MIILEKPYVSDFLQKTVVDLHIPVLATDFSKSLAYAGSMNLLEEPEFFELLRSDETRLLYSNSENAAALLNRFLPDHPMTRNVSYFKDKSKLRELFLSLNPDVWYKTFFFNELDAIDFSTLSKPFVIKPVRGFASIGIHAVHTEEDWNQALLTIKKEVKLMHNVFPDEVVSLNEFLIERYIEGQRRLLRDRISKA